MLTDYFSKDVTIHHFKNNSIVRHGYNLIEIWLVVKCWWKIYFFFTWCFIIWKVWNVIHSFRISNIFWFLNICHITVIYLQFFCVNLLVPKSLLARATALENKMAFGNANGERKAGVFPKTIAFYLVCLYAYLWISLGTVMNHPIYVFDRVKSVKNK